MPGARLQTFRLGDRSELLVEQLLAGFAFTTRVPRQEDVGVDFFCSLIHQERQLLKAGPFFAVQAKSSTKPVVYSKRYQREWITNQENPLLICVANREALSMDVYSTWNLLCGVLNGWRGKKKPSRILLRPGEGRHDKWPWVTDRDDGSQEIRLGKPIARITDAEIFNAVRMKHIAKTIGEWVALDRTNIVNRHANMHWVLAPRTYETNKLPSASSKYRTIFYRHPKNLEKLSTILGRFATTITLTLSDPQTRIDTTRPPWSARMSALRDILRSHWEFLDESTRKLLVGKDMKP